MRRAIVLAAVLLGSLAAASGCAMPGYQSPELMARCTTLFLLWYRYDGVMTAGTYDGEAARAVLAHYRCEQGRFEIGLRELVRILKRNKIPVPPIGTNIPNPGFEEDL